MTVPSVITTEFGPSGAGILRGRQVGSLDMAEQRVERLDAGDRLCFVTSAFVKTFLLGRRREPAAFLFGGGGRGCRCDRRRNPAIAGKAGQFGKLPLNVRGAAGAGWTNQAVEFAGGGDAYLLHHASPLRGCDEITGLRCGADSFAVGIVPADAVTLDLPAATLNEINVTADSSPGWIPTVAQRQRALKTVRMLLDAVEGGRYAEAYGLQNELIKRNQTLAQFTQDAQRFSELAGPAKFWRVLKVTWTKGFRSGAASGDLCRRRSRRPVR